MFKRYLILVISRKLTIRRVSKMKTYKDLIEDVKKLNKKWLEHGFQLDIRSVEESLIVLPIIKGE